MRRYRKPVVIGLVVLLSVSFCSVWLQLWPTDPRLHGTFRSDQGETLRQLLATKNVSVDKLKILRQMYGHMTYTFSGHKMTVVTEHHVIEGYPEGAKTEIAEEVAESYFFVKKEGGQKASLLVLPNRFWRLTEVQVTNIAFDGNGFWVASGSLGANGVSEKFTRM